MGLRACIERGSLIFWRGVWDWLAGVEFWAYCGVFLISEIDSGEYWKIGLGLRIKTSFPLNNMPDGCVSLLRHVRLPFSPHSPTAGFPYFLFSKKKNPTTRECNLCKRERQQSMTCTTRVTRRRQTVCEKGPFA
jgi:hypothetical protein